MTYRNPKSVFFLFQFLKWYNDRLFIARIISLTSILNYGLVLFDLTYIPLRDIWLNGVITVGQFQLGPYESDGIRLKIIPQSIREIIIKYDVIKGIVPYRDTENYLQEVKTLENTIITYGLNSKKTEEILANLREMSANMISEDPFRLANKSGTLEIIKNRMRDYMNQYIDNPKSSSTFAFTSFWTVNHLKNNTRQQLDFFNNEIAPLINTNYFRPIGENGQFVDYFGLIDFPFFVIIFTDFLIRSFVITLRHRGVKFQDAIFWRWYDLIFLLPEYRWLRIIPIIIRLNESKLLTYKRIKKQISQGFVAEIAGDLSQVIVLRIINQIQKTIEKGGVEKILLNDNLKKEYIDLNNVNESAEIIKLVINLIVEEMLPEIRPEVEILLTYMVEKTIRESPMYQNIPPLPTFDRLPESLGKKLAHESYQVFLNTINNILKEDPVFEQYLEQIISKASKTLMVRPQAKYDINKIEELLVIFLEEIKINYIQNLAQDDIEALLDETRTINQQK